ncbi:SDR family NAD(P)-dependent oxidoreductase [Sphingomonas sp.]|uniref:SDR family NAD(P)-dependent oxidoreductase n=1 Tax=Sphingomonas sp. TaxID=28214 RepID=UPI000DB72D6B|nr:SDR family NAD(P)-dependent oxidoreductase [Sphingomonas sp.]PZU09661.1 MAG: short-chain dehydrogenase [Sphingomonas sp.]
MTPEFGSPRTAIVTGGGRRIGAAFVRALSADGWTMLIHCHESRDEAEALAAEIEGARIVQADLAAADCGKTIVAALAGMPPAGLLVNSASRFDLDRFDDFTVEGWDRHFLPNLRGPALLTRAFAASVPEGAGGLIVNILDAKLAQPNPDFFTYTLSKFGLAALTELSARVLAEKGIRVCGIAPSVTLVSGQQTRENFDSVHEMNALRSGVTVDDLVAALRFLVASPRVTGEIVRVDGGQRFLGLARDVQFLDERPS